MSEERARASADMPKPPERLAFHYIKSNLFRVIHIDGAWGGITPSLNIHMALYNERNPIPQRIVHAITKDGGLDKEILEERVARDGMVREVETDIIMSAETAKALIAWLTEKVSTIEKHRAHIQQGGQNE